MNERVELRIVGKVQGVWYRASAAKAAQERGLVGWVRNMPDGSVEAIAEGPRPALESFIDWCRKGPPAARVDEVRESWSEAGGELTAFDVRR
ncbi:acylphosphatase [Vulgatibacter incomptus]|uniref:acylphosphatase n=1 Tax=Vulgatibacter incomptus TaxID=1391653 RepID=A0A0K1PDC6_9BACT|nr:acylphosphatase [Vulgatibacter incomptus]AKU91406.1 Acylphosphate phosphohydrolase [Vulgatibacter incomptus]